MDPHLFSSGQVGSSGPTNSYFLLSMLQDLSIIEVIIAGFIIVTVGIAGFRLIYKHLFRLLWAASTIVKWVLVAIGALYLMYNRLAEGASFQESRLPNAASASSSGLFSDKPTYALETVKIVVSTIIIMASILAALLASMFVPTKQERPL